MKSKITKTNKKITELMLVSIIVVSVGLLQACGGDGGGSSTPPEVTIDPADGATTGVLHSSSKQ